MNKNALYTRVVNAQAEESRIAKKIVRLNDGNKFDEAEMFHPMLAAAKREFKDANSAYLTALDNAPRFPGRLDAQHAADLRSTPEYMKQWLEAFKNGVTPKSISDFTHSAVRYQRLVNALTESGGSPAGEDGGFLAPIEFDGMIHELMREYVDLANYVNHEFVTSLSGWRVVEQAAAAEPLTKDGAELEVRTAEGEAPKFVKVNYSLEEYKDFLRVSSALLQDTSTNLMTYLARWFSKKIFLTHNLLILALINAISPTAVTDYKTLLTRIKTTLNKTLDPAFSATASIFTNQSGFDVLDQLDDGTGRPLLQPDPTSSTAFRVKGRPVITLSDAHWPNLDSPTRAPFAIGDGREYLSLFERAGYEFASTSIGGSAWRSNSNEVKGIARLDCKEVDTGAMVLLEVTLP